MKVSRDGYLEDAAKRDEIYKELQVMNVTEDVISKAYLFLVRTPENQKYYFEGRFDLVKFVKTVQDVGLFVHLCVGPYACAKWNYGSRIPSLATVHSWNSILDHEWALFKYSIIRWSSLHGEMELFLTKIGNLKNLFASQGGPIILAQVENEYGNVEWAYVIGGELYVQWAAETALNYNISAPRVMCLKEDDPIRFGRGVKPTGLAQLTTKGVFGEMRRFEAGRDYLLEMISQLGYQIYLTLITFWSWWWEVDNQQDDVVRTILTFSILALVLLWYKWTLTYTTMGKNHLSPGPYGLPVVGYLPFLGSNLHERFTEMAKKYGLIFSLQLGCKLHVVVNFVDLVEVVARERDHTFANRTPPITTLEVTYGGVDVAWSNNNAQWRNMRKLLVNQVLSSTNLTACQSYRTHEVRKTVNQVYNKIGKKIDINEIAFKAEVNVVTSMLWGRSKSSEMKDYSRFEDEFRQVEHKIIALLVAPNISDFLPMLSRFELQGVKQEMKKQFEYLDRILDTIIKERIEETSSKRNGMDVVKEDGKKILLELKDRKDCPKSFSMDHVKALLVDMVIAAIDTTSTMVEWVMTEILNNPGVIKNVQDELTEVIGMKIVEESDVPKLTYLDAVVKETFRLHPLLPLLIQRCPDESCMMAGYTIPKGTIMYMNVWAIHRDPDVRGRSGSNACHITRPVGFKNPMVFLQGRLVVDVNLGHMLLDAILDFWPKVEADVGPQVKVLLQSYITKIDIEI
ncbi:cytochrome P450 76C1-like protein [Tanacetum coccineum]